MRRRQSEIRDQRSERVAGLLRRVMPPVDDNAGSQDLWPAMLLKLRAESVSESPNTRVPWFDWALVAGLALLLAAFPAAIPVLLYYL